MILDELKSYLKNTPKEQVEKDWKEIQDWYNHNFTNEEHNEDLEEEIQRAYYDKSLYDADNLDRQDFNNIARHFAHFAEWQKQQMKEALQTEYEKGRFDMREEMMKDAQLGMIEERADGLLGWNTVYGTDVDYRNYLLSHFKNGDKVKLIIIKED